MTDKPNPPLVTFAIALRRPNSVADKKAIDEILSLTLWSIYGQSDGDFRILIGAAQQVTLPDFVDDRTELVCIAGRQPRNWKEAVGDQAMRRFELAKAFAERGGGYLMFVDHDDFVSCRIVEHVRKTADPHGYYVFDAYVYDAGLNVFTSYPPRAFGATPFYKVCGSCLVLRFTPEDILESDASGESLYGRVDKDGHGGIVAGMRKEGRPLTPLPFPSVMYALNTGQNTSRAWDILDPEREERYRAVDESIAESAIVDEGVRAEFRVPERYPSVPAPAIAAPVPTDAPSISVLICTYRRPEGLKKILTAVVPQTNGNPAREIIVVNDGSHDDAYAGVATEFARGIRYRALKSNVGVAAARNAAAALATGDYLVFTDDDCEPPPCWLDWLAARLAQHPELDVVAGTTKPLWPEKPTFFARVRATHSLIPITWPVGGMFIFPTANVAIRRSLFESLGGFGFPGFCGAGEDTELATRIMLAGAATRFDPNWYTRHEITEGFFALCRRYRKYGHANGRLMRLTTSPITHDYMQQDWRGRWRDIWRWEMPGLLADARKVHGRGMTAEVSAAIACLVKIAYRQGVKDAFLEERAA